jgi:hypothetical protein
MTGVLLKRQPQNGAEKGGLMVSEAVFILVFSIASGGGPTEGQFEQNFATKKECMADRERLLEAHRQNFPPGLGKMINAHCKQVKRSEEATLKTSRN